MNTIEIKRDWLKLVAGEVRGLVWVRIPVRHPETSVTLFNENLALLAGDREVTVVGSDNPDSQVVGATLALSDIRSEVTGPLGSAQRFLRRLLRLRFRAEIAEYFKILKDLQTLNLPSLATEHLCPEAVGDGDFKHQTKYGFVVVSRLVVPGVAVSFTLVRAPEDHPITAARGEVGVTVVYLYGRPLNKPDQTLAQGHLFDALGSIGLPLAARQPVTVW